MDTMTHTTNTTNVFVVGDSFYCRSLGDWDCIYAFTVLKRTAKFVTLQYFDDTMRVGVKIDSEGSEYCHPFGVYSMCVTLRAINKDELR